MCLISKVSPMWLQLCTWIAGDFESQQEDGRGEKARKQKSGTTYKATGEKLDYSVLVHIKVCV